MNVKQTRSFLGASPLNAFTNVLALSLLAGCLCSSAQANPLRYGIEPVVHYTFETDSGSAVTNNQPVVRVDDQSGNNRHLVWANATNAIATYVSTTTAPVGPTGGNLFRLFFDKNPPVNGYSGHLNAATTPEFNTELGGNLESFMVDLRFTSGNVNYGESQWLAAVVKNFDGSERPAVSDYHTRGWAIQLRNVGQSAGTNTVGIVTQRESGIKTWLSYTYTPDNNWHALRFVGLSIDATTIYGELYVVGPTGDSGIIARPFYSGYSLSIMGDGKKDPKVSMDNFIFGKPIIPPRAFVLSVR